MPRVLGSAVGCSTGSALVPAVAAAASSLSPSVRRPAPLTLLTTPTSATPSQLSTTQARALASIGASSPRGQAGSARAIEEPQPSSWALEQQARANERASQRLSQAATQLQGSDDDADDAAAGSAPMEDLPDAPEAATSFHPPSHQLSPPPLVPFKSARSGSSLPLPLPEANEYEEQDEEARDKMNEGKYDSPGPQNKQTSSSHNSDRSGSRSSGSGSSSGRQSDPSVLTGSHFGSSSLSQSGTFGDIQFSQIDMMDDGSQPLPSDSTAAAFSTSSVTTQMSLTLSTSQQKAATMADEPSGTPPLTQVSPPQPTRTIGGAAAQLHAQQQRRAFYKQPVVKTLLPVNRKRTLPPAPIFTDSPPTPRQPEPESTPQPQRPVQPIQKEPEKKVAEVAQPSRPPSSAAARQFDALFSSSQPPPSRDNSVLTQAAAGVGGTTASAVPAQQPAPSKQTSQPQQPSSSSSSASSAAGSISAAPSPSRKRDIDPAARAKARRQREDRYRELYPQIKGDVEAANDLTNNDLVAVLCCQGLKNITTLNKPALLAKVLPFIIEDKLALPVVRAAGAAKAAELQGASASASKKLPNLALYATQPTTYSDDEGEPASLSQGNKRHKTKHASSQEQAVFEQPTAKAQQKPKPVQHAAAAVAEAGGNASAASSVSRSSALQPWVAPPLIFRDTKYLRPPCTDFPPYSPCSFILHAGSDVVVVAAEYLRFRVEHMFAINQLAALQSQQESQQRFVKARQTINSLAIPTGLVHAKVLSFYPIISEELSKQKPQHSGGGAACRGWNHPPPSPWCELTLQVTEGAFAGEHFTLFYIDASWTLPNDAPSERRQLTVHNCAPFLLDKTRYDQLRSYDWSVGELFQMPLVSYSTQTAAEQGEPMVPVAAAPSAANLVVVMRVGRIISIKPVFPPHIDPMNFAQSPYHALKVLWLTKQIEPGEKFVYDAWNQDIPCVSFWEILPHSAASDQLATCMAPIACPSHSEHGFKAALRRHITKILEEIYELGWRPLWLRQPQSSQVHLFSSLMTTPVSAFVAVRQQFIEICENHQRGYYSDWNAVLPDLLSLLRSLNDLEHEFGSASSISAAYPGLVSISAEAPLPLDLVQLEENCQTDVLQARMAAEARVEEEWNEQCPQAMGAIVAAISKLIHERIAVEPTWTEHFGAMQISETAANDSAVEAERPPATRTQDRQYSKLSQLMAAQK